MTEAVILSVVEKLERLLVEKAAEQVKGLRDDLRLTLGFIAEQRIGQREDSVRSVGNLAHDADVAIDTFICNVESPPTRRAWLPRGFQSSRKPVNPLLEFGWKIEYIRRQLQSIHDTSFKSAENWLPLGLDVHPTEASSPDTRSYSDVVGLRKDVELLLQEAVFHEEASESTSASTSASTSTSTSPSPASAAAEGVLTTCIVGMGGVGKSTLAGIIYNHERVASGFEFRAWVYVPYDYDTKSIFWNLILNKRLKSKEEIRGMDEHSLREVVFQHLRHLRYFVVLNCLYQNPATEFLLGAFPPNDRESRLLVTSSIRNIIGHAHYIHEVKLLDSKESRQLFLQTVTSYEENTNFTNHLIETIWRKISSKCNGLPMAIIEAGNQFLLRLFRFRLSGKEQLESELESFVESMDLRTTTAVLSFSYHTLPRRMKSFFLCVAFFREGTSIRLQKWVQVWSAGEMFSRGEDEEDDTAEEIGRKYLDELNNRCMVEAKDMSIRDYRIRSCYINSNFHMLAVKLAKEELRFEILKRGACANEWHPYKPRHLSIFCSRDMVINYSENQDHEHLVSLVFHGGASLVDASPSYWKRFQLLKILDLEGFGLKMLPDAVGKLFRLKYLGLRNNFIQELPRSLGGLKKLEVLDIAQNFTIKVPNVVWKLNSLRHLYMSDIIRRKPLKVDALKNLETLTYISVDTWKYKLSGLEMMNSLRKLGIEDLDRSQDVSKILASLVKLKNLDCLVLRGCRFRSMPSLDMLGILNRLTQLKVDGLLTKLPSVYDFPPNVRYLTLVNTSLDEDPMPVLGKLPHLLCLKLWNAYTGKELMVSDHGFVELEVLCIGELWGLRNLQVGEGAIRKMKRLEINSCPNLESLPEEIGSMANLKELKMVTTRGIARKILKSGLISKIRHVDIQS